MAHVVCTPHRRPCPAEVVNCSLTDHCTRCVPRLLEATHTTGLRDRVWRVILAHEITEQLFAAGNLSSRTTHSANNPTEYEFLRDFRLAVFDEAHRSIAPTFTSVMQDIGLTYRRTEDKPFLLGLTATPYRGHDQAETARLVRRYGQNRLDAGAFC